MYTADCACWEHIKICMLFEHLSLIQGEMPLLRNATIGPSNLPHSNEPVKLQLLDRALQLKRLTHLVAEALYSDEITEILREATQLASFELDACSGGDTPLAVPAHYHLQSLLICATSGDGVQLSTALDSLTLPALRILHLYQPSISVLSLKAAVWSKFASMTQSRYRELFPSVPDVILLEEEDDED
ncbi:hypothetical protein DFH06DRAFT_1297396 [Mycena polygramma]|nr:hypothetical protein DFH06DRAFT_1297396 [Mycena polygramma]